MIYETEMGEPIVDIGAAVAAEERTATAPPWVMVNMVASVDGATTVAGGSTDLSDGDDRRLFRALRSLADVVLVGAGTVRAENYRPIRPDPEWLAERRARGQADAPRLVVVSGRLDLDPSARMFGDPERRPTIVTSEGAPPDPIRSLSTMADMILLGSLSGRSIIEALDEPGLILCEGGPGFNATLLGDDLVDEINLTLAPLVVSGESKRVVDGVALPVPATMRLSRLWRGDRSLFLRYTRDRG